MPKRQLKKATKKKGKAQKGKKKALVARPKTRKPAIKKTKTVKKKVQKKKSRSVAVKAAPRPVKETRPAQEAITLETERTKKLRLFLIELREKIFSEARAEIAKYMKGETKQIVETALDDGDWSVVDLAEDISLRQLTAHRENLIKIDEALRKLDQGTYGICEECGESITEERLKILPFAIYCRECQERKEVLEKIEKEYE